MSKRQLYIYWLCYTTTDASNPVFAVVPLLSRLCLFWALRRVLGNAYLLTWGGVGGFSWWADIQYVQGQSYHNCAYYMHSNATNIYISCGAIISCSQFYYNIHFTHSVCPPHTHPGHIDFRKQKVQYYKHIMLFSLLTIAMHYRYRQEVYNIMFKVFPTSLISSSYQT